MRKGSVSTSLLLLLVLGGCLFGSLSGCMRRRFARPRPVTIVVFPEDPNASPLYYAPRPSALSRLGVQQ